MWVITPSKTDKIEIVALDRLDEKGLERVVRMYLSRWWDVLRAEFEDKYLSLTETHEGKGRIIAALDKLDGGDFKEAVGYNNGGNFTLTSAFREKYMIGQNQERLSSANLERRIERTIGREEVLKSVARIKKFPEGQKVALVGGAPEGAINSLIADDRHGIKETWSGVASNGYITNHTHPDDGGNTLVCFAIYTAVDGRTKGTAKALIKAQKEMAVDFSLKRLLAYSRFTDYKQHMEKYGKIPPEKYIFKKDERGRFVDHAIGLHLSHGAYPVKVLKNARPADENSCGFCIIMEYPLRRSLLKEIPSALRFGSPGINHILQLNGPLYTAGNRYSK